MKNILVVCALPIEMKGIKENIKALKYPHFHVDFLVTWVWNYHVIYSIKDYISKTERKPHFIINIWVCWKSDESILDDFFQVYRIKNAANRREVLPPVYIHTWNFQSLLSSESVITNKQHLLWEPYVDMESYGVDFIATKEKIPFIIIKKPFDVVSCESKKVDKNQIQISLQWYDFRSLFEKIDVFLDGNIWKLQIQNDLLFYKDYFRFTVWEFEIFKKNYNKFVAYEKDFQEFFDENKKRWKKMFLEKMLQI